MLVLDETAHPVGALFPGGDRVHAGDGVYWCPVPQTPDVGYLHSPLSASERLRRPVIDHYHDGHYNE